MNPPCFSKKEEQAPCPSAVLRASASPRGKPFGNLERESQAHTDRRIPRFRVVEVNPVISGLGGDADIARDREESVHAGHEAVIALLQVGAARARAALAVAT